MRTSGLWRALGILVAFSLLSTVTLLPGGTPTPKPKTMKLKFTSPLAPPPFLVSETAKWWADEVTKRSEGRVEWEFYWLGALTKAGEELEAVQVGLAQVGSIAAPYYAGKLPLSNWNYAVPFGPGDPKIILEATKRLYNEVPELQAEVERYNQKIFIPMVIDTYNLTSKRPIVKFEDFKGIKIASIGAYHPKILNAAGASAIHMPVAERYTALQTGVIEAEFLPWDVSFAYKYHDYNKHATWVDMGSAMPTFVAVNLDFWKKLPGDLQELMLTVATEATERNMELIKIRREEAIVGFKAAGVTFHEMPFEDKIKWANALPDIPAEWIREMEGKRLAGRRVMVRYLEILEEMGHKFPRKWAADYR
jgi:TRAP-type C4-dicarboxylate transport system substrate-binding protein